MSRPLSRRALVSAAGAAVLAAAGGTLTLRARGLGEDRGPDGVIPSTAPGDERVEVLRSEARRRKVAFYTAVPAGYGGGRGLPVCLVLHGASATADDFPRFGLGRFLTAAVDAGAPPFVLAGATGDRLGWRPSGRDDPQRMVREELPAWCAARGFDAGRIAAWGWSMGGFGSLLLAQTYPRWLRAVAAFSPAVRADDEVVTGAHRLSGTQVGLWCGRSDDFYDDVRALERALPEPPAAGGEPGGGYGLGGHTRGYWNRITPEAFAFIARALSKA
jgi:S-formylglutathione hydrolase FrmB